MVVRLCVRACVRACVRPSVRPSSRPSVATTTEEELPPRSRSYNIPPGKRSNSTKRDKQRQLVVAKNKRRLKHFSSAEIPLSLQRLIPLAKPQKYKVISALCNCLSVHPAVRPSVRQVYGYDAIFSVNLFSRELKIVSLMR